MSDKDPIVKNPVMLPNTVNSIPASDVSKLIAEAVAEALKVAIPAAAIGIQQAQMAASNKSREQAVRELEKKLKRCPICALPESCCGGAFKKDAEGKDIVEKDANGATKYNYELNHVKEYVGPKDENLFRWFQGVIVNGVRFLADYPGHKQWIPRKSDILTTVNAWEANEKELSQKRTAEGMGVGSVGPGGARKGNQNFLGWRG